MTRMGKGLVLLSCFCATAFHAVSARATNVALFDNDTYVDSAGGSGAEADNMQAAIISFGHVVTPFTGITAADFTAAFAGNQVFVMPEQENAELNPDLDDAARAAIRDFVESGGRMIIASDGTNGNSWTPSLINAVFGLSVTNNQTVSDPTDRVLSGTIFDNAAAQLPENNATEGLDLVSLPAGALNVYADATVAVVTIIPAGEGEIIFLGYDWYNSDPPNGGAQDGGWTGVLEAALADADLAIAKTASPTLVDVGEDITYTLTVTNNGPNDAVSVLASDFLPAGVTLVSAVPSQGDCTGSGPVDCDLGALANGASATITIVVTADIEADLTNRAEVSGAMVDPDPANNEAVASVTAVNPLPPAPNLISGAGCGLSAGMASSVSFSGLWAFALAAWVALRGLKARR